MDWEFMKKSGKLLFSVVEERYLWMWSYFGYLGKKMILIIFEIFFIYVFILFSVCNWFVFILILNYF